MYVFLQSVQGFRQQGRDGLAGRVVGGGRHAWKSGPVLRRRAVLPLPAVHRERHHPGRRRVILDGGEQAGLRQLRWKIGVLRAGIVSLDRVHGATVMIEEIELAGVVFAKGKPIELIDSNALLRLIHGVQTSGKIVVPPPLPERDHLTPN